MARPERMPVRPEWEFYGPAGHFIDAKRCRYHLHTHVRREGEVYCVSTVGEYYLPISEGADEEVEALIGAGRLYETMAFRHDETRDTNDWSELLCWGGNDREAAERNHLLACWMYTTKDETARRLIEMAAGGTAVDASALAVLKDRLLELNLIPM